MRLRVKIDSPNSTERVCVVPSEEDGIFVVEGGPVVGRYHTNRAVGRVGLVGFKEHEMTSIARGDIGLEQILNRDPETGSVRPILGTVDLIAQIEPGNASARESWKSIQSFKEYRIVL